MSIQWNNDDLNAFFGTIPCPFGKGKLADSLFTVQYDGSCLKYQIILDCSSDIVSISGSHERPFSADSLFEITIPCDSITVCADGYYPEQTGLNFWYGDVSQSHNQTMQLLKRPDGDLKVWPACVWPPRHPNFDMLWGDNNPAVAYERPHKDQ